jgi:hypothetical protein
MASLSKGAYIKAFYNLIINVAVSVGIAIAAALIDFKALNFPGNDACFKID